MDAHESVLLALVGSLGAALTWALRQVALRGREIRRLNAALLESARNDGKLRPATIDELGEATDPPRRH